MQFNCITFKLSIYFHTLIIYHGCYLTGNLLLVCPSDLFSLSMALALCCAGVQLRVDLICLSAGFYALQQARRHGHRGASGVSRFWGELLSAYVCYFFSARSCCIFICQRVCHRKLLFLPWMVGTFDIQNKNRNFLETTTIYLLVRRRYGN